MSRRRWLVTEVVQTSAMDCGPASLKCLLEGFGVAISYGRLREACQTDVDGTSIDTLEDLAGRLGLAAEQIMIPIDHLLRPEAEALPAIVVVIQPNGLTHFVVAWRRHGGVVQVMDPATGRRWPSCEQFLAEVYQHAMPVPAAAWRAWAGSDDFLRVLRGRLADLGVPAEAAARLIAAACAATGWRGLAVLDAGTRLVATLVASRGVAAGREASDLLAAVCRQARDDEAAIPASYWSVRPGTPGPDGEERVLLRGAVLVRVRGRRESTGALPELTPDLAAALQEPPDRPGRELLRLLRADGVLAPFTLIAALAVSAVGMLIEALLFRGLFDIGSALGLFEQRLGAIGVFLVLLVGLLAVEVIAVSGGLGMGRRLEARLRASFMAKIPYLGDRYVRSRPVSDMAERSHNVYRLRLVPDLGRQFIRACFDLVLMAAGLAWLHPTGWPIVLLALAAALALPLAVQPLLTERDLRVRTHVGALAHFYLDALLGLAAIKTHRAERAMRREHESLLVEWARSRLGLQAVVVYAEGVQFLVSFGLAAWLLFDYVFRAGGTAGVLLLAYWALNMTNAGTVVALVARDYTSRRNLALRMMEPLGARAEHNSAAAAAPATATGTAGVAIGVRGVTVRAAGHTVLQAIDLAIAPGSHVAIVGPSGAGKSSLVGVLLGWHRPAEGEVLVDGVPLDADCLARLRGVTAWVDPAIQLWNRSLLDNLRYGAAPDGLAPVGTIVTQAELRGVLEKLPQGLQTPLGEGGGLVSGGEGQRVRFGRALLRPDARLVILDEPFRGLDREARRMLLARARAHWPRATLLCITHDVSETATFERVLVMEGGRVVEDGRPGELAAQPDTRYRAMLAADQAVRHGLWSGDTWQRLQLATGRLASAAAGELADER